MRTKLTSLVCGLLVTAMPASTLASEPDVIDDLPPPYRAQDDIDPGKVRNPHVEMEPAGKAPQERIERASGQRWRAWGTLVGGAVITGGSVIYLGWALKNQSQANSDFNRAQGVSNPGGACSGQLTPSQSALCGAAQNSARSEQTTANNRVLGGYIATSVGAAVLVTGWILALTVDDTSRYEGPRSSLAWLGWAKSNGGGLALAGRF